MNITKCKGVGHGSCKRCTDNGKWNRVWMSFLYKIEGLEGCYCSDCTKEIQNEKRPKYRNVGMPVEDRMYDGICDGCDQDPTMCYNQGYCEYDREEIKDERV